MNRSTGAVLVVAAAVLWGTTGTAQEYAPDGTPSSTVGLIRVAIGGLALLGLAGARRELRDARKLRRPATLAAIAGMAAYQPLFFGGVARTGVAVGTVVAIGSAPVLAGALAYLVRSETPGRRWALATALAVTGTVVLVAGGDAVGIDVSGVLLTLGAGLSYATFAVAAKTLLEEHDPVLVMAIVFMGAAAVISPYAGLDDISWVGSVRGSLVALHLGLIATALAYVLFAAGLARTDVATTTTLTLAEPLTASALGLVLLGEDLTFGAAAGAALVLAGLVLLATRRPATTPPRYSSPRPAGGR